MYENTLSQAAGITIRHLGKADGMNKGKRSGSECIGQ